MARLMSSSAGYGIHAGRGAERQAGDVSRVSLTPTAAVRSGVVLEEALIASQDRHVELQGLVVSVEHAPLDHQYGGAWR